MKRSEFAEIKNLDIKTLSARVIDLKKEIEKVKLEKDVKDTRTISKKRRDIAMILTVLTQKKMIENLKDLPAGRQEAK